MDDATPVEEEGLVMLALAHQGHQSEGALVSPIFVNGRLLTRGSRRHKYQLSDPEAGF